MLAPQGKNIDLFSMEPRRNQNTANGARNQSAANLK